MTIVLERIYDTGRRAAGYRVLVDRLWPRGVAKQDAALDEWCKALAPSSDLRKWFGHDPARWTEFQHLYTEELHGQEGEARALLGRAGRKNLVLLYGAKDSAHTHAIVLKRYLSGLS